jgi:hypothetical protein
MGRHFIAACGGVFLLIPSPPCAHGKVLHELKIAADSCKKWQNNKIVGWLLFCISHSWYRTGCSATACGGSPAKRDRGCNFLSGAQKINLP